MTFVCKVCIRLHTPSDLQLGHNPENKYAKRYTYQAQTLKPVFMSENIASVMELIAAGHCVIAPHVAGVGPPWAGMQALCGIQYDKVHASLTERDEGHWKHNRT